MNWGKYFECIVNEKSFYDHIKSGMFWEFYPLAPNTWEHHLEYKECWDTSFMYQATQKTAFISGDRVGRLTILFNAKPYINKKLNKRVTAWWVLCDCGNIKRVRGSQLVARKTQSCGCISHEYNTIGQKIHGCASGGKHTKEYMIYNTMLQRCYNENNKKYKDYGGRGISVCEEWKSDFTIFLKDMGEKPANKTLGRIDNDGNYSKDNCEWQDYSLQGYNRRRLSVNTSGRTGVYYRKDTYKWRAIIAVNGDIIRLGQFDSFEEAAAAREAAEIKYYGFSKI